MELLRYKQVDCDDYGAVLTIYNFLITGHDPQPLFDIRYGNQYSHFVDSCYYVNTDVDESILSRMSEYICMAHLLAYGYDPAEFEKFNNEQLYQIWEGYAFSSAYAKPEYSAEQMEVIRKGIVSLLDMSIYAKSEYSAELMQTIYELLTENIDPKPFLELAQDKRLSVPQLATIGKLYRDFGAGVIDEVKKNINIYADKPHGDLKYLIVGSLCKVFKLSDYTVFSGHQLESWFKTRSCEKLEKILEKENGQYNIEYPSPLKADLRTTTIYELLQVWYKGGKILPAYMLMIKNNNYAFRSVIELFNMTGVSVKFDKTTLEEAGHSTEGYMKDIREHFKKLLPDTAKQYVDKYDKYQLAYIYQGYKKGLDIAKYVNPDYSAFEMRTIAKYLERGFDISQHMPPAKVLKSTVKEYDKLFMEPSYAELYDYLGYMLTEHRTDLFDDIKRFIEHGVSPAYVSAPVKFVATLLHASRYISPEQKDQLVNSAVRFWNIFASNFSFATYSKQQFFYNWRQLESIYIAMTRNLDVSVCFKPEYAIQSNQDKDDAFIHAICTGLGMGIDLTPYADYIVANQHELPSKEAKYCRKVMFSILRILKNHIPVSRPGHLDREHPFYVAVNIIEKTRQQNRTVSNRM